MKRCQQLVTRCQPRLLSKACPPFYQNLGAARCLSANNGVDRARDLVDSHGLSPSGQLQKVWSILRDSVESRTRNSRKEVTFELVDEAVQTPYQSLNEVMKADVYAMAIEFFLWRDGLEDRQNAQYFLEEFMTDGICSSPNEKIIDRMNSAFALVVHALIRHDQLSQVHRLARRFKDLYSDNNNGLHPNTTSFNAILHYLSSASSYMSSLDKVLDTMIQAEDDGKKWLAPNLVSYNTVIHAYALDGAVDRAKRRIVQMIDRVEAKRSTIGPNTISFNGLLNACAKSGKRNAGQLAEEAFLWMEEVAQSAQFDVRPDKLSFTIVIDAYSKGKGTRSAEGAEKFLRRMLERNEQGYDVEPDVVTFTSVIASLADTPDGPEKATSLFEWMKKMAANGNPKLQPNAPAHNVLMHVWARSNRTNAGDRAKQILDEMKAAHGVEPTRRSYNTVINAYARNDPECGKAALSLLKEMEATGERNLMPDHVTYNSVLNCLANCQSMESQEIMSNAEMILSKCQDDRVATTVTYNAMMKVSARHDEAFAVQRIRDLLDTLESATNRRLQPNTVSYLYFILALAKQGGDDELDRVRDVFNRMQDRFDNGDDDCAPNNMVINSILRSCLNSNDDETILGVVHDVLDVLSFEEVNGDGRTFILAVQAVMSVCAPPKALLTQIEQVCAAAGHDTPQFRSELDKANRTMTKG